MPRKGKDLWQLGQAVPGSARSAELGCGFVQDLDPTKWRQFAFI